MRFTISWALLAALVACGGGSQHNPDAAADTAQVTSTLTLTNYTVAGPVNAPLVAVQDGDGPWSVVSGNAGVYTTMLHGDRYGITVACTGNMYTSVFTIYAAVSDGTTWFNDDCTDPGPSAATISGTVSGAASTNIVRISNGFDTVDLPAGMTTYTLPTTAGPSRLFAEELVNDRPIKIALIDTTVTDSGHVNFDLATGFAPVTHTLSANGMLLSESLSYRDVHNISRLDEALTTVGDYRALPATQLGSGLERLVVGGSGANNASQTVIRYFSNPVDETIALPPLVQLAGQPTATATPYPTATAKLSVAAGTTMHDFDFSTSNSTTNTTHDWYAQMTAAYAAKAFPGGAISYTMPDLHALPGWQTAFQLESGQPIDWYVEDDTNSNLELLSAVPPGQFPFHDGSEEKFTSLNGQLAAP
jgi:hypothetical protein